MSEASTVTVSVSSVPDDAPHILVIDDDKRIRDLIARFLLENGYRVTTAEDASSARSSMRGLSFDLLILDIMMPGETGLSLAQDLRTHSQVPILMLTARTEPEDRIAGLEIGADDYLAKPFDPRELLLRMKNILNRRVEVAAGPEEIAFGRFIFHPVRGELSADGEPIKLTEIERNLLRHFALNPATAIDREDLARLAGHDSERAVDVQINRLRRKIETDPANPAYLQTVRGRGYIFYIG